MKILKSIIFFSILLLAFSTNTMHYLKKIYGQGDPGLNPDQELLVDQIKKNLKNTGNNHIQANVVSAGNNSQTVNITVFGVDFIQSLKDFYNKSNNKTSQGISSFFNWINSNKKDACLYTALGIYSLINIRLVYLKLKLNNIKNWSFWQKSKSLEELYQIPQSQFSKMLLTDIQQNYMSFNNPTDFVSPLIKFIQDTNKEEKHLSEYIFLNKYIQRLYLSRLFFAKSKELELESHERIKRLVFMKNTFLSWLADYKMTQAQKTELFKRIPGLKNIK